MRLNRLTIKNITSIEDATINFNQAPLDNAPLFLICGETGAGKTTILDAICLALYNKAPRMANSPKEGIEGDNATDKHFTNDVRNFMRPNTGEAWSELEFEGNDGNIYTAKWYVSRARKKIDGTLQSVTWTFTDNKNNHQYTKVKEVESQIDNVIGLNFDQFCRTTMLAQGEFTKFLKSDAKEKSEILEKLTGTDIYTRVGIEIFNRYSKAKSIFEEKKDKLKDIRILTPEELQDIANNMARIETQVDVLKVNSDIAILKKNWLEKKSSLETDITTQENGLKGRYIDLISGLKKLSGIQGIDLKELQRLNEIIDSQKELSSMYESYQSLYAGCMDMNIAQGLIDKSNQIVAETMKLLPELEEKKKTQEKDLESKNAEWIKIDSDISGKESEKKNLDPNETLAQDINKVSGLLISANKAEIIVKIWMDAIKDLEVRQNTVNELLASITNLKSKVDEAQKDFQSKQKQYDDTKALYDKQQESVKEWASEARASLNVGDTCPVCGQEISTVLKDEDFKSILKPLKDKLDSDETKMKSAESSFNQLFADLKAQNTQEKDTEKELEDLKVKAEKSKKEGSEICQSIGIELTSGEESLTGIHNFIVKESERSESLKALNEQIGNLQKSIDTLHSEKDELDKVINGIKNDILATGKEIDIANNQIQTQNELKKANEERLTSNLENTKSMVKDPNWLELFESDRNKFIEDLKGQVDDYHNTVDRQKELANKIESRKGAEKAMIKAKTSISELVPKLVELQPDDLAEEPDYQTFTQEPNYQTLAQEPDYLALATEAANQNAVYGKCLNDKNLHESQKPELAEEDTVETLSVTIAECEAQSKDLSETKGQYTQQLADNNKRKTELEKELNELKEYENEFAKWEKLNSYLGDATGSTFRKIAQSYVLEELLQSANEYLKQLTDRYNLTCEPGSLSIQLIDEYQGEAERPVTTLSGGEGFIVSLALALALSSIGDNALAVDTLFIDEGFGTLSEGYLETVIGTLKRLHEIDGKKVGIISHVAELREQIPVKIEVTKADAAHSVVNVRGN